jgi:cytochrome c oxidase assembly factor CtaG
MFRVDNLLWTSTILAFPSGKCSGFAITGRRPMTASHFRRVVMKKFVAVLFAFALTCSVAFAQAAAPAAEKPAATTKTTAVKKHKKHKKAVVKPAAKKEAATPAAAPAAAPAK